MKFLNKFYPHLLAFFGFVIISLCYFYPVLQGKALSQSDIVQYTGMAKEQNDFRAAENTEPYWTNSAFGGMPTYQLGANYPNDYIGALDDFLRFLPRPADYLFLYFLGFYSLLLVLKVDPLKAFFGALAFGFSTYMIIILGVGHNAKAHAIAYMPLVLAGVIMVFQRKYVFGGILTMIALALEINANHFQMTYYLLFLLLIVGGFYIYQYIKNKEFKPLLSAIGVFAIASILAIGSNATNLLATSEYADFSMRGKSELTFNPDGSKNETTSSMDYDYITEYSYGIAESFNLIAPRLFGGGNSEKLGKDSHVYEFISKKGASPSEALDFTESYGATYWGDQPIVAAPAYIGAIVFMLFVLAMFIDKRKIKYAFLAGAIFTLLLSWGKNLSFLTNLFIDFVPFYDKFRAVSSIQVIVELCIPLLAIMGLQSFFKADKNEQIEALKKTAAVSGGVILLLFVSKFLFDFAGPIDARLMQMFAQIGDPSFGVEFMDALKADRKNLYSADLLRSGFLIIVSLGILWLYTKEKLAPVTTVILIGVFMVGDLVFVDRNYVDASGFVSAREVKQPFQPTESDMHILQDTSHYRVYEVNGRLQARTSYFHKSLSGYSAVRPRRMEQLFNYQIDNGNMEVLNMLNTKYVIQVDDKNQEFPALNDKANGNAWFISKVKWVSSPDEEMKALDKFNSKEEVIINEKEFAIAADKNYVKDSSAQIALVKYKPNYIKYKTQNKAKGLAVFSEIYYPKGWIATIDGKEAPIFRVNYTLRGLEIPAGNHTVEFKFEPQVVKTGSTIVLISGIGMLLLILGGIYFERKRSAKN
ncbi:YfhO family protein [Flavobacterium sp.]|uniref:YfhO family protein n=1 Tax=Flavobacterium sp. TaxID=239 RepID=UPI00260BA09A|nr:YfhO family protein [Flavobacterium sp.]MDD3004611.1 YfhO family protein [Flavobacterium sp.]